MKKIVYTLLFFMLVTQICFAQFERLSEKLFFEKERSDYLFKPTVMDSTQLDSIILDYKNSLSIPGIATLIIKDNDVVWNKNYGYRNLQYQLPVEDTTLFLMASISKTITVTAAMQLWENGWIDLDSNINSYLPIGLTVINPYHSSDIITVRMLMTHSSSLLDNWNILYPTCCGDSPISLDSFLINYLTPGGTFYSLSNFGNYVPGQQWNYTSVGTGLLALMTETITGKAFTEYCRDSIFIPLSMNSTSWFLEGLDTNLIATPYIGSTPGCHPGWPLYPGGFLRTNKIDLSKFLLAYLNNGIYNNKRILDSTTISYMLSDQLGYPATYLSPWWVYNQGLIWFNAFPINITGWGHAGSWPGCLTYFCYDPNEKWGIIWFQNWRPIDQFWISSLGAINHQFTKYAHLYGNIYAFNPSVNKSYAKVNIDSVLFRTRFSNIYNHQFTPHLIYANLDSTLIDSLTLFDDGLHGDSLANDGIFGEYIPIQQIENFYLLSVSTVDNQTSKYFNTPDICRFTTAGPVVLDSISYTKGTSNYFNIKVYLSNQGITKTISSASVRLICNDDWISTLTPKVLTLPAIPPGETVSTSSQFRAYYVDSLFPGYFNFKVEVMSDNWLYWSDSVQVVVGVEKEDFQILTYKLEQNYPNPFNPNTVISYQLPISGDIVLKVFDVLGNEIATLVDEYKPAGKYEIEFSSHSGNVRNLTSGVYFYQLRAGDYVAVKKMLFIK